MSVIFPVKSPVSRFGEALRAPVYKAGRLKQLSRKFKSLLETREEMDEIYSNGYFDNHYPDAAELLKKAMHEQAMQAWAKAKSKGDAEDDDEDEKEDSGERKLSLQITINVGE